MKKKKILFVNTNRYRHPPVIPLGIEYLIHSLRKNSFDVEVNDLCFSDAPSADLGEKIRDFRPDAVCLTIRNLDTALFRDNEFFLPQIREDVGHIRSLTDSPLIIGGAALSIDPAGIMNFVGADVAVAGPGEETLPLLLRDIEGLRGSRKVFTGRLPDSYRPSRPADISYGRYLSLGGIPGFETHKGCTSLCAYCVEAGTPVRFRRPSDIVCEVRDLVDKGYDHFHLCDSEFNEDIDFSIELLGAMTKERLNIRWALYMKPGNYNRKLFQLLSDSGAYLITLAVDTFHKCPDYWTDVQSMIYLAKRCGIRTSIDLLTGFPYETEDTLKETLALFLRTEPDEVVVNVFIRIYRNTKIRHLIDRDRSLRRFLTGTSPEDDFYLSPCFYNHVSPDRLRELINGERLFRIAGEEKLVNYQKAT